MGSARPSPAWVIVTRGGSPFLSTVGSTRKQAILSYEVDGSSYHRDRRRFGVQAVRCTVTPQPGGAAS